MIVSDHNVAGPRRRARAKPHGKRRPGERSLSIQLTKTLYAQAPHATLHAPYCKVKHLLAGCQFLVSTDGKRLSAVVAYTNDSVEFTWSLAGRSETLRNLIAQVRRRLARVTFLPVMETGRAKSLKDLNRWQIHIQKRSSLILIRSGFILTSLS